MIRHMERNQPADDMLPDFAEYKEKKIMQKTILITGSTDGIGLETARMLVSLGHHVLLHGRNPAKLKEVEKTLSALSDGRWVESHVSDLSRMADVEALAKAVTEKHAKLDVLINNAGVYGTFAQG